MKINKNSYLVMFLTVLLTPFRIFPALLRTRRELTLPGKLRCSTLISGLIRIAAMIPKKPPAIIPRQKSKRMLFHPFVP